MQKAALIVLAMVAMMLLAIGCSNDDNPITSDTAQIQFRPNVLIPPAIGDRVWDDMNMDGLQGDMMDEPGLAGMVIHLYMCDDTLGSDTVIMAVDTTDSMGYYGFEELAPGNYYLFFVLPDGYMFSPADQGTDDALDSDADPNSGMTVCITIDTIVIDTSMGDLSWDAGMYMPEIDNGCTRGKGYWKNHAGFGPQDDMVTDLLPIWLGHPSSDTAINKSMPVTDAQIAVHILHQHVYGHPSNGITKLYAHLLATKLNIAAGANCDDVEDYIAQADDFLTEYDWMDWESLDKDQRKMILGWKDMFDEYNNGEIGPGHCDDMDDDNDDDDTDDLK